MQKNKNPTDILYRLRGLCRRHETKGNKKPPVQKVQTVAVHYPYNMKLYKTFMGLHFWLPQLRNCLVQDL